VKLKDELRVRSLRSNHIRDGSAAVLLEPNKIHQRASDLVGVLKREQDAINRRDD
jgi:hypothetical protein